MNSFPCLFRLLVLGTFCLLFLGSPLRAEEKAIPVKVNGDFLEYKNERQIVIIKGNVVAAYRDWRIECQTLQVNIKKEKLFAYGEVLVIRAEDEITGDIFVYDLKTGEGYIRNALIRKGVQLIRAEEIEITPDKISGTHLSQTTCDDPDHPHYRIEVDKIENIPDRTNRLEGQRLVILGKTVLARGMSLDKVSPKAPPGQKENQAPKGQGFTKQKGVFYNLSNTFNLLGNKGNYSASITQKQGNRGSLQMNYATGMLGSGDISSSFFHNPDREQTNSNLNLTNSGKVPFYQSVPLIGKFLKDPTYNFTAQYYSDQFTNSPANQELNTDLTINSTFMGAQMTTRVNRRLDPDGESNTSDEGLQYINRNPEISLKLPSFSPSGTGITFDSDLTYAKLFESRLQKETTKKEMNIRFSNPSIEMGRKMKVNISGSFKDRSYSEGEKQTIGQLAVQTSQTWAHGFTSQFNYDVEKIKGETPLSFESRNTRDRLQGSVNWNRGKRFSSTLLYFAYDAATQQISNVYQNFRLIQTDAEKVFPWEINLRPTYLVEGKGENAKIKDVRLTDFNTQFKIVRESYQLDVNGLFSRNVGKFVNLNTNVGWKISRLVSLGLNGRYDTIAKKFSTLDLALNRDYHCFDARLNFNKQREEVYLTFNLKAYPDETASFRYDNLTKSFQPKFSTFDNLTERLRQQGDRLRSGTFAQDGLASRTGVDVR